LGGTVFRNCVTAGTGSAMIFMMLRAAVDVRWLTRQHFEEHARQRVHV
jgi:hypothetical protein